MRVKRIGGWKVTVSYELAGQKIRSEDQEQDRRFGNGEIFYFNKNVEILRY